MKSKPLERVQVAQFTHEEVADIRRLQSAEEVMGWRRIAQQWLSVGPAATAAMSHEEARATLDAIGNLITMARVLSADRRPMVAAFLLGCDVVLPGDLKGGAN